MIAKFQNIVYDANYTLQIPDGGYVFSQNGGIFEQKVS